MKQKAWVEQWANHVGENVARLRKERGLSAQRLSDRCAQLGHRVSRNAITNLENGRKGEIPVHEVAILAAALGVPPVLLLFSPAEPEVWYLPTLRESGWTGTRWFAGTARIEFPEDYNCAAREPVAYVSEAPPMYAALYDLHSLRIAENRAWAEYVDAKAALEDARVGLVAPATNAADSGAREVADFEDAMQAAKRRLLRIRDTLARTYAVIEEEGLVVPPELRAEASSASFASDAALATEALDDAP